VTTASVDLDIETFCLEVWGRNPAQEVELQVSVGVAGYGTTWLQVVPEPDTGAFIAFGAYVASEDECWAPEVQSLFESRGWNLDEDGDYTFRRPLHGLSPSERVKVIQEMFAVIKQAHGGPLSLLPVPAKIEPLEPRQAGTAAELADDRAGLRLGREVSMIVNDLARSGPAGMAYGGEQAMLAYSMGPHGVIMLKHDGAEGSETIFMVQSGSGQRADGEEVQLIHIAFAASRPEPEGLSLRQQQAFVDLGITGSTSGTIEQVMWLGAWQGEQWDLPAPGTFSSFGILAARVLRDVYEVDPAGVSASLD